MTDFNAGELVELYRGLELRSRKLTRPLTAKQARRPGALSSRAMELAGVTDVMHKVALLMQKAEEARLRGEEVSTS